MGKKKKKYRHVANPELAKAMHEKAASNASGLHEDKRTKRNRDRAAKRRNAIKDQEE